jgi:hypothetical protein
MHYRSLLKNFLQEDTRNKVVILGSDYESTLREDFGAENVPKCYGGTCECGQIRGECIPHIPTAEEVAVMEEGDVKHNSEVSPGRLEVMVNGEYFPKSKSFNGLSEGTESVGSGESFSSSRSWYDKLMGGKGERTPQGAAAISIEQLAAHWITG